MSTKSTIPVEINSIIKSRSPSPLETPKTMSLVVQLGTCNNNIISNQQSSPLAATAVASPSKTVRQFPTSPELVASAAGGHNNNGHSNHVDVINNAIPIPQQTSLVVTTSQFQTVYKRSLSTTNQLTKHSTSSSAIVTTNGGQPSQRLQTLNVQRAAAVQLSHIAPQSKVQVISNVVVPKNTNYVLNKAPPPTVRQNNTTVVGNKQVITSSVVTQQQPSVNHRTLSNAGGNTIKSPQILNNFALQTKSQNYITATTVQPLNSNQQQRGGENIQNNNQNRTITKFTSQPTPQTHVISRVIAPITKTQPLKVNTSSMVIQQRPGVNSGIKTLPPQISPPTLNNNKNVQNSRIQNNIVVQQRSGGIKTIPPQRYGKAPLSSASKITSNSLKQNNFIVKNAIVQQQQPRQNLLSPKSKHQLIVQQAPNRLNSVNSNNVVKFHGQYAQETNSQQQQTSGALPSVTVVRTVASYEDNNVPSSIANTLFSPNSASNNRNSVTNSNHDELSQESYLSEDDVISEVRPDYSNCNINPVLFDHNYHLPPPDSPPVSPVAKPHLSPLESSENHHSHHHHESSNLSGLNVSQTSPSFLQYASKRPGEIQDDDAGSTISSDAGREVEPEGEETETAPEGEGDEDSVTRCICEFEHDDGYMICCDKCFVWQHVDCMFIDRTNIQEEYLCERCEPRRVDRQRARAIQLRKREEILNNGSSSDTSSGSSLLENTGLNNNIPPNKKRPNNLATHPQGAVIGQTPQSAIVNRNRKNDTTPTRNHRPLSASQRRSRRDLQQQTSSQRNNSSSSVRKNSAVKRRQERKVQSKRKTKTRRQQKSQDNNDESQEFWDRNTRENSTNSVVQLRQWIENYEEAVTNHYSPELRARIMKTKDQQNADSKVNLNSLVQASANVHKCRTIPQVNLGTKILVSTMYLPPNTPIIELRGKYMLGSPQPPGGPGGGNNVIGSNSSNVLGRHHTTQRPGPFLFFYKLPKDGTEVCVDTRTYGNDARFVRRSCKPNAEVRHCIEKGTLHLYLVSLNAIEKNTELTIRHDTYNVGSSTSNIMSCACSNPEQCSVNTTTQQQQSPVVTSNATAAVATANVKSSSEKSSSTTMVTRRSNGVVHDLVELGTQRKRRGRRTTSTSEQELTSPTSSTVATKVSPVNTTPIPPQPMSPIPVVEPVAQSAPTPMDVVVSPTPPPPPPPTQPSPVVSPVPTPPVIQPPVGGPTRRSSLNSRAVGKSEEKNENITLPTNAAATPSEKTQQRETDKKDKKKMTREERKMEAIMKAFERLEKQEQRKQESKTRQAHRRESDPPLIDHSINEMRSKRKKRKGRARTISTNSSSNLNMSIKRRTRVNSTDSYMTSGDDSSLTSPPLPSSSHDNDVSNSRNSIDSEINNNPTVDGTTNSIDIETENQTTRNDEEILEKSFQDVQHMSTEGHAAGLLLALANGGGQLNEDHLKSPIRDPDTCSSAGSVQSSPGTPVSSNCLLVAAAVEQITPGFKFPKTKKAIMNEWLNKSPESSVSQLPQQSTGTVVTSIPTTLTLQTQTTSSSRPLELQTTSLSVSPLTTSEVTSSSPCRQSLATLVQAANICSSSTVAHPTGGNAKKRWLRQAISEECDSPNSRPESPHAPEMIAPPKKRRLARESLSSEQSFTPPTTPTRPNSLNVMNEDYECDQILGNDEEYYEETTEPTKMLVDDNNSTPPTPMNSSPISSPKKAGKIRSNNIQENGFSPSQRDDLIESPVVEKNDKRHSTEELIPQSTTTVPLPPPNNISLDPRLRYESPQHCLGKVEETLQLLESWTYTPKTTANESIPPAKRKLSISEYRQRKQQVGSGGTTPCSDKGFSESTSSSSINTGVSISVSDITSSISTPESPRPIARTRTNSASSATSSLSSDDDIQKDTTQLVLDLPEKDKSIISVAPAFNSAPTHLERQRENLTARLKREFGLFVPEDDESKKNITIGGETSLLGQRLSLRTSSFLTTPPLSTNEESSVTRSTGIPPSIITESTENSNSATLTVPPASTAISVDIPSKVLEPTTASTYLSSTDTSHLYPTPSVIPNGAATFSGKNAVVPSMNFITPFDNPVYPNTTYYTGFPTANDSRFELKGVTTKNCDYVNELTKKLPGVNQF
ncbi:inactive histone-lysine N-methyltransferase 2E isoform X2 [Chrysoperla carnea]|uniref:inactive histone-lysine N-methyltransferase 2E isoform X2 n=1 Tax=Chrysoperla carnea TaxID=189513 RepID=UPI001D091310|nr:inactive histone-lysine N-methyltransferase 2E isoform X2 [Chrysoperla carnea]